MRPELHELERYVHDALGVSVKPTSWSGADRLPHFLKERYRFAQAELLGLHVLLVIDINPEEQSPATVRKHMDLLHTEQHADLIYIYVRAQVTAYNRPDPDEPLIRQWLNANICRCTGYQMVIEAVRAAANARPR